MNAWIWLPDCRGYCTYVCVKTVKLPLPPVSEIGWCQSREENSPPSHTLKFGPAIERRQGKLVQKMKAHASESGQVHAQHPGVCGQRSNMAFFRSRQTAATFSLSIHQYGRSFFLFYIEKMAACNFLSAMKILICFGTAEIYVRLFGTAQMIGIFQG